MKPAHDKSEPAGRDKAHTSRTSRRTSPQGASLRTPEAQAARLQALVNDSPRARSLAQLQKAISSSPRMVAQRAQMEAVVGKAAQRAERKASLPEHLKAGVEGLAGVSMAGVTVHYNSTRPARLQALAYTQGADIHVAPGQEKHLPHEAWHVAQQRQGRVSATSQVAGVAVNDHGSLEREADEMGARAARRESSPGTYTPGMSAGPPGPTSSVVQRTAAGDMIGYLAAHNNELTTLLGELQETEPGVTMDGLKNTLLDPAYDFQGAIDLNSIWEDLTDALRYTACYATAADTYNLMGADGANVATGANQDSYDTGNAFRVETTALNREITTAFGRTESIFKIEFAGHGFVLLVRQGAGGNWVIEHLESLAHTASMLENLTAAPTFTLAQATGAIRDMASDDIEWRRRGAGVFGWNADMLFLGEDPNNNDQIDFPRVRMKWWQKNLRGNWLTRWQAQVSGRFNNLAENVAMSDARIQ